VVSISVSDDDVVIPVEAMLEFDVDSNDVYSLVDKVLSIVLVVSSAALLEMPFVVEEIPSLVNSSDSIKVVGELDGVVNIDVSEEVPSLFTVVVDAVDDVLICRIVESV
jgi:hypothetical protein